MDDYNSRLPGLAIRNRMLLKVPLNPKNLSNAKIVTKDTINPSYWNAPIRPSLGEEGTVSTGEGKMILTARRVVSIVFIILEASSYVFDRAIHRGIGD
jgi:hypothetical protein